MPITPQTQASLEQIFQSSVDPSTGILKVQTSAVVPPPLPASYDYIAATYPSSTQEVYTYKLGGSGGATVATVTLNYTDTTKNTLLNFART